jgi:5-methylcytosine-specific restriction endonuclease McrA
VLSPLGPKRYKLQLTANQALHDKLRQAQDLMRHEVPDGDLGRVLERALELLIAQRMKRRFGMTSKPRARRDQPAAKQGSRHIPHAVRRPVLARDGVRCSYVSPDGKRCEERGWLQLHHEQPFGRGGPATLSNIRVLCRSHNQLLAERDYGRAFMQRRIERARSEREEQLPLEPAPPSPSYRP